MTLRVNLQIHINFQTFWFDFHLMQISVEVGLVSQSYCYKKIDTWALLLLNKTNYNRRLHINLCSRVAEHLRKLAETHSTAAGPILLELHHQSLRKRFLCFRVASLPLESRYIVKTAL